EPAERFTLNLSNALNGEVSDGTGVITIGASDQGPAVTPRILAPADMIVSEAEGYVDLVVRLSARSTSTVSVDYATQSSTASGGNNCNADYTLASGKLIFAPGETTKVVRVQIVDCPVTEAFKGFTFELSGEVNSTIGRERGRISIVDNDIQAPTPTIHVRDAFVDEKDGVALVSVLLGSVLGEKSLSSIDVDYATADGSAADDSDYTASAGTLTFAPGETTKTVVVPITDDGSSEPGEAFTLGLSNPTNAALGDGTGLIVIGGNDQAEVASPGIFAPADVAVSEGAGYVDLVVNLGVPGLNPVSVDYTTVNETASGGNVCNGDYVVTAGELVFGPGETSKVVRVQIVDCPVIEGAETFRFQLSGATGGGVISRVSGRVTIGDNDGTVTLDSIAVTPTNPSILIGADQQFTATGIYSDAHTEDLTGSATWGSATTGVATISAGGLAHGVSAGTSTISAVQSGITGSTVLTVTQAQQAQTITFAALPNKTWGDPDFTASASASSGLPVSFAASGSCTIAGTTVHISGAGNCTITASQAGNGSYLPATPVARSFTIGKAGQTISFGALADRNVGDPDFDVSATASSGLAVNFSASGSCTVSGQTVHLTGAGTCTITAAQAGNANINAATPVARSFLVTQLQAAAQTITFAALGNKTWGDPDFTVSASASTGLPVGFSASGNCTVTGTRVHITGAGSCTITASQPGNA
ncbi:MAG TPA: Calx-beta domain-containing protein, partial [Desertimonas sp.]|nr:Calx-beta domain-containing protein [Desertimonas sp.]